MNGRELVLRQHRAARRLDLRALRPVARHLLEQALALPAYRLGVTFTGARRMARMNRHFLRHAGSTDVITFDHRERPAEPPHGELFIGLDDAAAYAAAHGLAWPEEAVRCLVHGVLHLLGHDDHAPAARRAMKRAEDRLVRRLARQFDLPALARPTSLRP
jgi:rRNA maturation RNase YbeY